MSFMNDHDIYWARQRYASTEVLAPATETLVALHDWANENSDGWAYWPKPARSAAKLMELIQGGDATPAQYRKALAPIKAFRTRMTAKGMPSFEITEITQ